MFIHIFQVVASATNETLLILVAKFGTTCTSTDSVRKNRAIMFKVYVSFCSNAGPVKAMLHGAIFLATCNAILLLRDVN